MASDLCLLALDPGGTTGCAVKMNGQYTAFTLDLVEQVYDLVADTKWTAVAYENFTSAGNINAYGHHTIRLCGAIEALCYRNKVPFFVHMPQNRYPFMARAKSKLGRVINHQVDAMAHLLLLEVQVEREQAK